MTSPKKGKKLPKHLCKVFEHLKYFQIDFAKGGVFEENNYASNISGNGNLFFFMSHNKNNKLVKESVFFIIWIVGYKIVLFKETQFIIFNLFYVIIPVLRIEVFHHPK